MKKFLLVLSVAEFITAAVCIIMSLGLMLEGAFLFTCILLFVAGALLAMASGRDFAEATR